MIRGRRVRASAADGANGPPRLPTATGPTSPGPVPGPPAVPELLMNKTRTFPTTAPFGRSNENRTHRASPVQTYVDPRWPLRCSRVPGSGPPSSSIRIDEEGGPDPGTLEHRRGHRGSTYVWTGEARCVRFSLDLPKGAVVGNV